MDTIVRPTPSRGHGQSLALVGHRDATAGDVGVPLTAHLGPQHGGGARDGEEQQPGPEGDAHREGGRDDQRRVPRAVHRASVRTGDGASPPPGSGSRVRPLVKTVAAGRRVPFRTGHDDPPGPDPTGHGAPGMSGDRKPRDATSAGHGWDRRGSDGRSLSRVRCPIRPRDRPRGLPTRPGTAPSSSRSSLQSGDPAPGGGHGSSTGWCGTGRSRRRGEDGGGRVAGPADSPTPARCLPSRPGRPCDGGLASPLALRARHRRGRRRAPRRPRLIPHATRAGRGAWCGRAPRVGPTRGACVR